jgi:hypothetical protein
MRGNADISATVENDSQQAEKVPPDFLSILEGDCLRLDVDSLAQSEIRPFL